MKLARSADTISTFASKHQGATETNMDSRSGIPDSRWKFAVTKSTHHAQTPPIVGVWTFPSVVFVPNTESYLPAKRAQSTLMIDFDDMYYTQPPQLFPPPQWTGVRLTWRRTKTPPRRKAMARNPFLRKTPVQTPHTAPKDSW